MLSAGEVAGCYEFTDGAARPVGSVSGLWTAPVQLDTVLALLDGDGGYHTEAGRYSFRPTAAIPESLAGDTALLRPMEWRIAPPDTLILSRSMGHRHQVLTLQPREEGFAGTAVGIEGSVVLHGGDSPPNRDSVFARRVPCPTHVPQASRPSA